MVRVKPWPLCPGERDHSSHCTWGCSVYILNQSAQVTQLGFSGSHNGVNKYSVLQGYDAVPIGNINICLPNRHGVLSQKKWIFLLHFVFNYEVCLHDSELSQKLWLCMNKMRDLLRIMCELVKYMFDRLCKLACGVRKTKFWRQFIWKFHCGSWENFFCEFSQ